jgi:hypothetical protein
MLLLRTSIPDSVLVGIIVLAVILSLLTIVLMRVRTDPAGPGEERRSPPFDPVLLGSAIAVIIMAGIAYFTL